jgi:hypothetical protein
MEQIVTITNKVIMRDPVFIGAVLHSVANIMSSFIQSAGDMLKAARPEVLPQTEVQFEPDPAIDGEQVVDPDGGRVLLFDPTRKRKK